MLTLKSIVALAAVAVFSANAAPTPGETTADAMTVISVTEARAVIQTRDVEIEARNNHANVRFCKDHYFQGACLTVGIQDGVCLANLSNEWNDVISSYEVVNRPGWVCRFYEHDRCNGAWTDVQYDNTLHDGGGAWADRISSIRCWIYVPPNCGGSPFC